MPRAPRSWGPRACPCKKKKKKEKRKKEKEEKKTKKRIRRRKKEKEEEKKRGGKKKEKMRNECIANICPEAKLVMDGWTDRPID